MGNKIRMVAYANPNEEFTRGGFGLVRFNKAEKSVTFESWDRTTDCTKIGAKQMQGWPRTVRQDGEKDGYAIWKLDPFK